MKPTTQSELDANATMEAIVEFEEYASRSDLHYRIPASRAVLTELKRLHTMRDRNLYDNLLDEIGGWDWDNRTAVRIYNCQTFFKDMYEVDE